MVCQHFALYHIVCVKDTSLTVTSICMELSSHSTDVIQNNIQNSVLYCIYNADISRLGTFGENLELERKIKNSQ